MDASLDRLQHRLGYQFDNLSLLETAMTHRSLSRHNNERLEFLGDAFLNTVTATELFERLPEASEGDLTRLRSRLVCKESLAEIARDYQLEKYLRLGGGMLRTGAYQLDSVLEDAFEALVGAIYLDAGFEKARVTVKRMIADKLLLLIENRQTQDAKTRLQELLQGQGRPVPTYTVIEMTGPGHKLHFRVECQISHMAESTQGEGSSRRLAEMEAAKLMLEQLENNNG